MKDMWVGYNVGRTMGLLMGHGAWQIDRPSNGSIWNSYSFQPVGPWMGYAFTDLGAEGCCCSLNALLDTEMARALPILLQGMEYKDFPVLYNQYFGCWWFCDTKSQGIRSHDTDQSLPEYTVSATMGHFAKEVNPSLAKPPLKWRFS